MHWILLSSHANAFIVHLPSSLCFQSFGSVPIRRVHPSKVGREGSDDIDRCTDYNNLLDGFSGSKLWAEQLLDFRVSNISD